MIKRFGWTATTTDKVMSQWRTHFCPNHFSLSLMIFLTFFLFIFNFFFFNNGRSFWLHNKIASSISNCDIVRRGEQIMNLVWLEIDDDEISTNVVAFRMGMKDVRRNFHLRKSPELHEILYICCLRNLSRSVIYCIRMLGKMFPTSIVTCCVCECSLTLISIKWHRNSLLPVSYRSLIVKPYQKLIPYQISIMKLLFISKWKLALFWKYEFIANIEWARQHERTTNYSHQIWLALREYFRITHNNKNLKKKEWRKENKRQRTKCRHVYYEILSAAFVFIRINCMCAVFFSISIYAFDSEEMIQLPS